VNVWYSTAEWIVRRKTITGQTIGFVPTMGALHRGHATLVERCRRENDVAVVSLFVNPTQFNDPRDLDRYPRTTEQDLALLESLGADDVITPGIPDFYPNGYRFRIEPPADLLVMEGVFRPGHLQGVLTVVMKLLNLVRADRAYFGEKDYQQLQVVTEMAREFFLSTEIVPCATVREESGLAESSRNRLLSAEGRTKAAALYRALTGAATAAGARAALASQGFRVEYVEEHWGRRLAAVYLEGIRLIDNVAIQGGAHVTHP
jgi:pantoate--beta-alanine ligase